MKRLIFILLLTVSISGSQIVFPQSTYLDPQNIIAEIVENLSKESDGDLDVSSIVDDLNDLLLNPVDLNNCDIETLSKLQFLTDFQLQSLWDYIQTNKPILNVYELQLVFGFEKSDVYKLIPFIRVGVPLDSASISDMLTKGKHEVISKVTSILETPLGYQRDSATHYIGDRLSIFSRYKYSYSNKLGWGLTGEKDAGEEFFRGFNSTGFDYTSGYIMISNLGTIKRLVVGDYDYELGQGLSFWSSQTFGKSINPLNIRQRAKGLKPHTSNNENLFLRGFGTTLLIRKFELTFYGSAKKIDGSVVDSTFGSGIFYSSLPSTGLHRTKSEMLNRHRLKEYIGGFNIQRNFKYAKFGLSLNHIFLDGKFKHDSTPASIFQQIQSTKTCAGIFGDFNYKGNFFFGEVSIEPNRNEFAMLVGSILKLSPTVQYSVIFRNYSSGYNGYYTSGFAENSLGENEVGIYSGLSILPIANVKISAYADLYSFPWLKYKVNAPSYGHDYLLQAEFRIGDKSNLLFKYRSKLGQENFSSELGNTQAIVCRTSNSLRFQFSTLVEERITLHSRFDYNQVNGDSTLRENGFLFAQNVNCTFKKLPLLLAIRFAIFDTDSWNSRIYAYENDLPYSFSVPASYLRGSRFSVMVKYSLPRNVDFWIRWSQSYSHDQDDIGSGLDRITGNRKNELKMMIKIEF